MEGHSDGSAGPLSYIIVVWWDKDAKRYGYFTCFKDADRGCEVRGTAHWDGDKFVNDDVEVVDGKKMTFRDTFEDITPNSHTLVFAWVKDDGSTPPVNQGAAAPFWPRHRIPLMSLRAPRDWIDKLLSALFCLRSAPPAP